MAGGDVVTARGAALTKERREQEEAELGWVWLDVGGIRLSGGRPNRQWNNIIVIISLFPALIAASSSW